MSPTLGKSKHDMSDNKENAESSDSSKLVTDNTCFECRTEVSNDDKALQCSCCNFWHHITCVQISVSLG